MTVMTLEDLIWTDESAVHLADSGFPIQVMKTLPDGSVDLREEMKIGLADAPDGSGYWFLVWDSGHGLGPVLVSMDKVSSIEEMIPNKRVLTLEDGTIVQYGPSRKCGCGSRLRGYSAWGQGIRQIGVGRPSVPWPS